MQGKWGNPLEPSGIRVNASEPCRIWENTLVTCSTPTWSFVSCTNKGAGGGRAGLGAPRALILGREDAKRVVLLGSAVVPAASWTYLRHHLSCWGTSTEAGSLLRVRGTRLLATDPPTGAACEHTGSSVCWLQRGHYGHSGRLRSFWETTYLHWV